MKPYQGTPGYLEFTIHHLPIYIEYVCKLTENPASLKTIFPFILY